MREKINKITHTITYILEILISIIIIGAVIIGFIDMGRFILVVLQNKDPNESYLIFQSFLGYVLTLVVAIELVLMLMNHSPRTILDLILFVIARKMLIYAHSLSDLVLGALAVSIVFFTMKYLTGPSEDVTALIAAAKNSLRNSQKKLKESKKKLKAMKKKNRKA